MNRKELETLEAQIKARLSALLVREMHLSRRVLTPIEFLYPLQFNELQGRDRSRAAALVKRHLPQALLEHLLATKNKLEDYGGQLGRAESNLRENQCEMQQLRDAAEAARAEMKAANLRAEQQHWRASDRQRQLDRTTKQRDEALARLTSVDAGLAAIIEQADLKALLDRAREDAAAPLRGELEEVRTARDEALARIKELELDWQEQMEIVAETEQKMRRGWDEDRDRLLTERDMARAQMHGMEDELYARRERQAGLSEMVASQDEALQRALAEVDAARREADEHQRETARLMKEVEATRRALARYSQQHRVLTGAWITTQQTLDESLARLELEREMGEHAAKELGTERERERERWAKQLEEVGQALSQAAEEAKHCHSEMLATIHQNAEWHRTAAHDLGAALSRAAEQDALLHGMQEALLVEREEAARERERIKSNLDDYSQRALREHSERQRLEMGNEELTAQLTKKQERVAILETYSEDLEAQIARTREARDRAERIALIAVLGGGGAVVLMLILLTGGLV